MKSCLLAAATQGPPTVCMPLKSNCQESVEVLHRSPLLVGDFPYCPTSMTNFWGPLPTGSDCERDDEGKSLCQNDKCMWGFIKPWESPTVRLVTATGSDGVSLFGSVTESITITTPHWGFLAPVTKTGKSTTTTTSTYDTSRFKSKKSKSSSHSASTPAPVCHDEIDCREYCDKKTKAPKKHMLALLIGGSSFTAFAGLAMLLKMYGNRIYRWRRTCNEYDRSGKSDTQRLMDAGSAQGLQLVHVPTVQSRNRGHVRFQVDGADMLEESNHTLRRASGHELSS
jgi:hypothetical protein